MTSMTDADMKALDVLIRGHIVSALGEPQDVAKGLKELSDMKESMGTMVTGLNKEFAAVKEKHRQHEEPWTRCGQAQPKKLRS